MFSEQVADGVACALLLIPHLNVSNVVNISLGIYIGLNLPYIKVLFLGIYDGLS